MSAVSALLAEAEASGVRLRVGEGGALRASGRVPSTLLVLLREHKAELVALLNADACRHRGEPMGWPGPVGVALDDGTAAHHACHERAETGRAGRRAPCPHPPAGDRGWT